MSDGKKIGYVHPVLWVCLVVAIGGFLSSEFGGTENPIFWTAVLLALGMCLFYFVALGIFSLAGIILFFKWLTKRFKKLFNKMDEDDEQKRKNEGGMDA